jgi:hypothetical protein
MYSSLNEALFLPTFLVLKVLSLGCYLTSVTWKNHQQQDELFTGDPRPRAGTNVDISKLNVGSMNAFGSNSTALSRDSQDFTPLVEARKLSRKEGKESIQLKCRSNGESNRSQSVADKTSLNAARSVLPTSCASAAFAFAAVVMNQLDQTRLKPAFLPGNNFPMSTRSEKKPRRPFDRTTRFLQELEKEVSSFDLEGCKSFDKSVDSLEAVATVSCLLCTTHAIDYRCEDGRFPACPGCVTISNPKSISAVKRRLILESKAENNTYLNDFGVRKPLVVSILTKSYRAATVQRGSE